MATEMEELISFLASPSPQVNPLTLLFHFIFLPKLLFTVYHVRRRYGFSFQITKAAVDIVRGLTGSVEGLQSLANYSNALLPALSRLLTLPKVTRACTMLLVLARFVSRNLKRRAVSGGFGGCGGGPGEFVAEFESCRSYGSIGIGQNDDGCSVQAGVQHCAIACHAFGQSHSTRCWCRFRASGACFHLSEYKFSWEKCLCFRHVINSFVGMIHTYDHRISYQHLKS